MREKKEKAIDVARKKYDAENTVRIAGIKFNFRTERDMIEKLRSIPPAHGGRGGIQGYIKKLIRDDLVRTEIAHETGKPHGQGILEGGR